MPEGTHPKGRRRQISADLSLLLVTLIWGSTFVMVKDAVATFPVFPFLTLRFSFATLALLVISWKRLGALGWRGLGAGALLGLLLVAGYAFQTLGLQYTSASKAGLITGLYVVIVPILSALVLRQKPQRAALLGVALATVGLVLLANGGDLTPIRGDLLILVCAFAFAFHIVAVSAFAPGTDPLALTTVQVATVAVISLAISLGTESAIPTPSRSTWVAAAFTGVLATALAFGIQTWMQRFTTPTHTALIFTGEPVFAVLFGVLLAGDLLTGRNIAGGILIVVGTLVSEVRWSEATATRISRFLSPQYAAVALLLVVGLIDPVSAGRGLVWAAILMAISVVVPLLSLRWLVRTGRLSDWHVSNRRERLHPAAVATSVGASGLCLVVLLFFDGPRYFMVVYAAVFALVCLNLLITVRWKISQHVAGMAVSTVLIIAGLGVIAAPTLLLIPLVAWARVKVGAHTVMQTIAGGLAGIAIALLALRAFGYA